MAMMTTVEKILAKAATLEAQAAALRLAASVLNGDLHAKKRAEVEETIAQAITVRRAQRPAKMSYSQKKSVRKVKRDRIIEIIRDYGKAMPIAKLAAAARAEGIKSLTGIRGYVSGGWLKQLGKRGHTKYRVAARPPAEKAAPPA
jgi:hypothetical protein